MSQHLEALALANEIRQEGARQRRELIGKPASVVVPALINPTPEFGNYKLRLLAGGRGGELRGLMPNLGQSRLRRALNRLAGDASLGRMVWHTELRLNELNERERKRLVEELLVEAPATWSEAA